MAARLIQFESGRAVRKVPLRGERVVLGRDASADVVFDSTRISRRHAELVALESGHEICDLGSLNGTRVNGQPLGAPAQLESGDRIHLGDDVELVYTTGASAVGIWLAVSLALVLMLAGGAYWWLRPVDDPVIERAAGMAREGLSASEAGRSAEAKQRLQAAVGLLYRSGRLDDVPRERAMQTGLERLGRALDAPVPAVFRAALEADLRAQEEAKSSAPSCRLDDRVAGPLDECVRLHARAVLRQLRQDPDRYPPSFYAAVHEQVAVLTRLEGFLERSLARGRSHVPMMRRELERARMPPLIHYLSLVESGYNPQATSSAGAKGLWQLMPATARAYGLDVSEARDERTDPEKSTRAAARYLRDLAFEFGGDALLLAIASYNRGENGVRRALKRLDDPFSDRSYMHLVERRLLPEETRDYVPRFIAAAVLGEAGIPSPARRTELDS